MIEYWITSYNTDYLRELWKDNWILSTIFENKMHCVDCGNLSSFYHNWDSICDTCKKKRDKESLYALYFIWIPVFIFIIYIITNLVIYEL